MKNPILHRLLDIIHYEALALAFRTLSPLVRPFLLSMPNALALEADFSAFWPSQFTLAFKKGFERLEIH